MNTLLKYVLSVLSISFFATLASASPTPTGRWTQIDDETGKPRSVLRVEEHDGKYEAFVEKVFPRDGEPEAPLCKKCTGDRKDQPVVGMRIMWELKPDGDEFNGGEILDPHNGKTYRCKMELDENGNALKVRGFIGISLLGRTQKWIRKTE